ncbi:peroxiredoxin [Candidatus Pacearchaeota archaeon]|nr:peroxiredoxin [Candidatus Pacearchaeota archaeon]
MLSENLPAPTFSLQDKDGNFHFLKTNAKYLVLYFYPKDDTPGCTIEAIEFSKHILDLKKLGAEVIGISGGDNVSKKKFCSKYNLSVTLVSDPDFVVSKLYGVYGEKSFMGKKFYGIKRTTFIISQERIIKIFENVKPQDHVQEIISFLQNLS